MNTAAPKITAETLAPALVNCLGAHELLRRLGFEAADIYVADNVAGVFTVLRTQGKEFSALCGPPYAGDFAADWVRCATAWNNDLSDAERHKIYAASSAFKDTLGFIQVLVGRKGIRIPDPVVAQHFAAIAAN